VFFSFHLLGFFSALSLLIVLLLLAIFFNLFPRDEQGEKGSSSKNARERERGKTCSRIPREKTLL